MRSRGGSEPRRRRRRRRIDMVSMHRMDGGGTSSMMVPSPDVAIDMHGHVVAMMMPDRCACACACPRTFVAMLKACSAARDLQRGRELHCRALGMGLSEENAFIGASLIHLYSSCGAADCLTEACGVLDASTAQDVVMWTSLIGAYCSHGCYDLALRRFEQMLRRGFSPNVVTMVMVLKACSYVGMAEEMSRQMERKGWLDRGLGLELSLIRCAMIDMHARCGRFASAREALLQEVCAGQAEWNALLSGLCDRGLHDEALKCVEQMQCEGITGDQITFVCCTKASRGNNRARAIHALIESLDLLELGGRGDIVLANALITMHCRLGMLDLARFVFDGLDARRDVVTWTALIDGYTDRGQGHAAIAFYDQMLSQQQQQQQHQRQAPNSVTSICGLRACASIGAVDKGMEMHSEIEKKGWLLLAAQPNGLAVGNALLDMYAKAGFLCSSRQLFGKLLCRDIVSWNILIDGYVLQGEAEDAFRSFCGLQADGLRPDHVTFLLLLSGCSRARLYNVGETCLDAMRKGYGIPPSIRHWTCLIDLVGREGRLDLALGMIRSSPLPPNLVMWRTVLGACKYWGNLELAKHVFGTGMGRSDRDGP